MIYIEIAANIIYLKIITWIFLMLQKCLKYYKKHGMFINLFFLVDKLIKLLIIKR